MNSNRYIFKPALEILNASDRSVYGPTSFRDYLDENDLPNVRTASYISVDSLTDLQPELKSNETMVLRLGSAAGSGTQFALIKSGHVNDFFLFHEKYFGDPVTKEFESPVDRERLLGYDVLPTLSETSLVNLGLASGLLSEAFDLDSTGPLLPPATGMSTFTFSVRAHSDIDQTLLHQNGQVEIDTLFAEQRDGDKVLFVIEAKTGGSLDSGSIAKHKLLYPIFAIADQVPNNIDIVPIYIQIIDMDDHINFHILECNLADPRDQTIAIDELRAGNVESYTLRK